MKIVKTKREDGSTELYVEFGPAFHAACDLLLITGGSIGLAQGCILGLGWTNLLDLAMLGLGVWFVLRTYDRLWSCEAEQRAKK